MNQHSFKLHLPSIIYVALLIICVVLSAIHQHVYATEAKRHESSTLKIDREEAITDFDKLVHEIEEQVEEQVEEQTVEETEPVISSVEIKKCVYPVDAKWMKRISSKQGLRDEIELPNAGGTVGASYHNALDISVPEGTPVYAVKDGTVLNCWPSYYNGPAKYKGHPTYGGLLEIVHDDGTKSLYAHLSMTKVREGEKVTRGQVIGLSGGVAGKRGSGNSTGPHLHFSIILDLNTVFED